MPSLKSTDVRRLRSLLRGDQQPVDDLDTLLQLLAALPPVGEEEFIPLIDTKDLRPSPDT